jgi:hypothetical protein
VARYSSRIFINPGNPVMIDRARKGLYVRFFSDLRCLKENR